LKNILVTTDLSEESKLAFEHAAALAKAFGSKVMLLAVIEDPAQAAMIYSLDLPVFPDPEVQKQVLQKVQADLDELAKKCFVDLPVEHYAIEASGPIHQEILNFAASKAADLIVIATHGRTGLVQLLIGSVTEKVVRHSPCPVLTVPIRK
jgi:nucleotide-binding universal stress UspA family protein